MQTFLEVYQSYCEEITDASPDYHRFTGLATLSIALGNKVYIPWGDTRLYPNMWLVLVGESTWDRKTTSIMISKRLLDRWRHTTIYPNEFSSERLIVMLSERPAGGFFFSELKTFIDLMDRDYMRGTRSLFTDLYDAPYKYKRELQSKTYEIDHPSISIQSASTWEWLTDGMKESDLAAGLFVRFLIIPALKRREDLPRPPMADKTKQRIMHEWLNTFSSLAGGFYLTNDAAEVHDKWYGNMRRRITGGRLDPFYGRLQGYLLKFAMLLQVNANQSLKIQGKTMEESVKLVEWVISALKNMDSENMVTSKTEAKLTKLKKLLRANEGHMARSALLKGSHMSSKELEWALRDLEEREEIEKANVKTEGARRSTEIIKLL